MITEYIIIKGLVQGIGYRPFVAEQAQLNNISGWVRNTAGIVTIMATGTQEDLWRFAKVLGKGCYGSRVDEIIRTAVEYIPFSSFVIEDSNDIDESDIPYIPADLPTCDRCITELLDINNRRYRHPFISCVACGPRYSIIDRIPYDRQNTLMKDFVLCDNCVLDYAKGRRCYAQTTACNDCGPELFWNGMKGSVDSLIEHLEAGGFAAVKDIGGYHLTCMPHNSDSVRILREIKARDRKPFAVLFPDVDTVCEYCHVNEREEQELLSNARPIVLLKHKENGKMFDYGVCMNSPEIGCMLPSNPIQLILANELGPVVMTSANLSGGKIITDNSIMSEWMQERLCETGYEGIGGILSHNRDIITPLDDSVVRIVADRRQMVRRARGYVPEPVSIQVESGIFAAGGDLKSVFCYTAENRAYLSQQFGDLEDERSYLEYNKERMRMKALFGFEPKVNVVDAHPRYLSRRNIENAGYVIQHHKAHVASVIAEHDLQGNVIGIAFDGTGYGDDGTVWGSEFFLFNGDFIRTAHLKTVDLLGGNEGSRNSNTILYGYINSFSDNNKNELLQIKTIDVDKYNLVSRAINCNINKITSSSMGRLFDAVSAILGICSYSSYEGEAAIELEYEAANTTEFYPLQIEITEDNEVITGDAEKLFVSIYNALNSNVPVAQLARGFIMSVADWIINVCDRIIEKYKLTDVSIAISGGTFLNRILVENLSVKFAEKGLKWYINEQVPSGDGGLCLGQVFLASLMSVKQMED